MKNILEYLEKTEKKFPKKDSFYDSENKINFYDLENNSKKIASGILKFKFTKKPIVIYFNQDIRQVQAILSVIYSGNFYVVLDNKMPYERINKIVSSLKPKLLIYDDKYEEEVNKIDVEQKESFDSLIKNEINQKALDKIRHDQIDKDILYIIYTSGTTGNPKGTVVTHDAAIKYIEWFSNEFELTSEIEYGAQMPFYFSASVSSFFSCLKLGFSYHIIPKSCFVFPIKLIEFLNQNKIDTIYWVPSALGLCVSFDIFKYQKPKYLKTILFAGEVMPVKYLNYFIKYLGNKIMYANLFGPTETVDICTFYKVDRDFSLNEAIPIGNACNNCDSFVLDDNNKLSRSGELCVRGSFLASGYYNDIEKTNDVFVQNPLNKSYPEVIYRTGDYVKYNLKNELIYIGRKDSQIKHFGYRIELSEIENAVMQINEIINCICIFDNLKDKLVLIYIGKVKKDTIYKICKEKIPTYMTPNILIPVINFKHNRNGKIDRKYYKKNYSVLLNYNRNN